MPQRLNMLFVSSRHCRETRSFGAGGGAGTGFSTTLGGGGGGSTGRTISFSVEHEESKKSKAETTIVHLEKNRSARSIIILSVLRNGKGPEMFHGALIRYCSIVNYFAIISKCTRLLILAAFDCLLYGRSSGTANFVLPYPTVVILSGAMPSFVR